MPCCKCVEYKWENPLPGTILSEGGDKYCLLHAPKEHRLKDAHEFRKAVLDRINATGAGDVCQLSGTVFPADFSFADGDITRNLSRTDFSNAEFCGNVSFKKGIFWGVIEFISTNFHKGIDFEGATLNCDLLVVDSIITGGLSLKNAKSLSIYFHKTKFASHVLLDNLECSGKLEIKECTFSSYFSCNKIDVQGGLVINRSVVERHLSCNDSILHGYVAFVHNQFNNKCSFAKCLFKDGFISRVNRFTGHLTLSSNEFKGDVNILSCLFLDGINFDGSRFAGDFRMKWAQIKGVLNFFKAQLLAESEFSGGLFSGNVYFKNTTFFGKTLFSTAKVQDYEDFFFRLSGKEQEHNVFNKGADFSFAEFKDTVLFKQTVFDGVVKFEGVRFASKTIFHDATFKKDCKFNDSIIYDTVVISNESVRDLPLNGELCFGRCVIGSSVRISMARIVNFNFFDTDLYKFNFYCCEWNKDKDGISCLFDATHSSADDLKKQELVYRSLRKIALDNRDEIMASDWHYQEKKTCRKRLQSSQDKSIDQKVLALFFAVYELCSGYGERPAKGIACIGYLVASMLVLLSVSRLMSGEVSCTSLDATFFREVLHAWLKMILFMTPQKWNENVFYFMALFVSRILLPVQVTLFTLSLRNKLRR